MKLFLSILFFLCILNSQNLKNVIESNEEFIVSLENIYKLKTNIILPNSETLYVDSVKLNKGDYNINYSNMTLSLNNPLIYVNKKLIITYSSFFVPIKTKYYSYRIEKDNNENIQILNTEKNVYNNIFSESKINKSGSISRGISLSSNKDMKLNSGFRLELDGNITDNIKITASLTDEKLPFQPDGNTEKLDQIDKVFINISSENFESSFGDIEINKQNYQLSRINRILQGLKINYKSNNYASELIYANPRGNYNLLKITGQIGFQGPYKLTGKNGEREILIVAGSEKVFLDGQLLKRGESNDYIIDYSQSEIIFTANKVLNNNSRIVVEYQYSDFKYKKSFLSASANVNYFDNKLSFMVNYNKEGDDINRPYEELSNQEIEILKNAGYDYDKAIISGVKLADIDSLGNRKGRYIEIDTLINSKQIKIYKFNPSNINAIYNVTFSYVGELKGDYKRESLGHYLYVGENIGNYLPIKRLKMPESIENINLALKYNFYKLINFSFEGAFSFNNENIFSNIPVTKGDAQILNLELIPYLLKIDNIDLGSVFVNYNFKNISDKYKSLERINNIEYERDYNIFSNESSSKELLNEIVFGHTKGEISKTIFRYGKLKKSNQFNSNRISFENNFNYGILKLKNNYNSSSSENSVLNSKFKVFNADYSITYNILELGTEYFYENKNEINSSNILLNSSIKYDDIKPYLAFNFDNIKLKLFYSNKNEYLPNNNYLVKDNITTSYGFNLASEKLREFRTNFVFNLIKQENLLNKKNENYFALRNTTNSILFDNFLNSSIVYETTNQKTSKFEKVFVKVPLGEGNYKYIGDVKNNGIADENDYELSIYDGEYILTFLPSNELIPVTELKFSFRNRIDFAKPLKNNDNIFLKALSKITNDFLFRIEEASSYKDANKIHFMNLKYFLNDSTTIRGYQIIQNDFYWNRFSNDFSIKYKYFQKKGLQNYNNGIENTLIKENSIRISSNINQVFNSSVEYINKYDFSVTNFKSNRNRILNVDELTVQITNKLNNQLDLSFVIAVGKTEDSYPLKKTIINENKQSVILNYALINKGKIRIELERNEFLSNTSENSIPFEVLKGNTIGKNYNLRLNFDYKITEFIQASLNYLGRKNGNNNFLNNFQAETKAYF